MTVQIIFEALNPGQHGAVLLRPVQNLFHGVQLFRSHMRHFGKARRRQSEADDQGGKQRNEFFHKSFLLIQDYIW